MTIRMIISLLGMYACALLYSQRGGMSVAIVAMTQNVNSAEQPGKNGNNSHNGTRDYRTQILSYELERLKQSNSSSSSSSKGEFDWDESLQGLILGSQFWLYIIVPTIAGRATDIFGGKWVTFIGTFGPFVLSLVTPVVTRAWGANALIVIRMLMGAFHGCIYPALFSLYVQWFSVAAERTKANAGLSFGGGFGGAVMSVLAGWLCETSHGWPLVFYVNAILYVPFMILWLYVCTNDPAENRFLSEEELTYIKQNISRRQSSVKRKAAKWSKILTSIPVWCSLITKMCAGFGYFLLLQKMPSYLSTIFNVNIFENGFVSGAATLAQGVCAMGAARLSNVIIGRTSFPSIIVRKIFQTVAMIGPALCLCIIPALGNDANAVMVLLVAAMLLYGTFAGGEWTTISDYAPNSAGVVFGFANILAFAGGVFSPYLVGVLLDEEGVNDRDQWNLIFYITAGIYVFGTVVYIVFGTDVQQEWDMTDLAEIKINQNGACYDSNVQSNGGSATLNAYHPNIEVNGEKK